MKLVKGVWLPDSEEHLETWADRENWRYQGNKLDAAMKYVKKFDVALDVGGHCGLWSKDLVQKFGLVVAFEPIPMHRECYEKNVKGNYVLHPYALGENEGKVKLLWNKSSTGGTKIHPEGDVEVEIKKLDDLYQGPCDFLKIDCEGYEEFVLRGAVNLLKHQPVVIVEQKRDNGVFYGLKKTGAVDFLKRFGYQTREVWSGDFLMNVP